MNKHGDPGAGLHGERAPEEIEREIELTRERMGRDLDALGEKLSPHNLTRQAKDAIGQLVRQHPVPVAAAGLGATWLLIQGNQRERSGPRRRSRHRVSDSPLVVAAGAAVLGLCVGMLVSSGEREHGWTRPIGDNLVDRAKRVARDATSQVREVAREEAPSIEDAASTVGTRVKRTAGRAKDAAKRATKKE